MQGGRRAVDISITLLDACEEIAFLKKVLRRCSQVVTFVEAFHCKFHTIVVTEFLAGIN